MIQRGGGKEGKKRRKSSVKDVTLLVVQDEVVEIEVPFDLLVFDSIQDANSAEYGRIPGNAVTFRTYCTLHACGETKNLYEDKNFVRGSLVNAIKAFLGVNYNFTFLLVNRVNQLKFEYIRSAYGSSNAPTAEEERRLSLFERFTTRLFFSIIRTEQVLH